MTTARNDSRLGDLATETWNQDGADLDLRSTEELVALMNAADATVPAAVARAGDAIADAIDAIVARLEAGGRLVYVGAGTSGRLAVLDALECQSTFAVPPGLVVALLAGGVQSAATVQEHAEDDAAGAVRELDALGLRPNDALIGISASGRTPYVVAALDEARRVGSLTVAVVCVEASELPTSADHVVSVVVGGEVVAGSTRLKAGTAQKLVLNAISTIAMIRLGKTFGNLMVDVVATNEKLRDRVRRIVSHATGEPPELVDEALARANGDARVAIVSLRAGVDAETARARLDAAGGIVRRALAE